MKKIETSVCAPNFIGKDLELVMKPNRTRFIENVIDNDITTSNQVGFATSFYFL